MIVVFVLWLWIGSPPGWQEFVVPMPDLKACHAILIDAMKSKLVANNPDIFITCDRRQEKP